MSEPEERLCDLVDKLETSRDSWREAAWLIGVAVGLHDNDEPEYADLPHDWADCVRSRIKALKEPAKEQA